MNRHGSMINMNIRELGDLPKEAALQLKTNASLTLDQIKQFGSMSMEAFTDATKTLTDPALVGQFNQLVNMQKDIVQSQMSVAYAIMFTYCAIAYLLAWTIMKTLVPKHKPITDY